MIRKRETERITSPVRRANGGRVELAIRAAISGAELNGKVPVSRIDRRTVRIRDFGPLSRVRRMQAPKRRLSMSVHDLRFCGSASVKRMGPVIHFDTAAHCAAGSLGARFGGVHARAPACVLERNPT